MLQKSQEHFRFYDSEIRPTTAKVERHKGDRAFQMGNIQISEKTREPANIEDPVEGKEGAVRAAENAWAGFFFELEVGEGRTSRWNPTADSIFFVV